MSRLQLIRRVPLFATLTEEQAHEVAESAVERKLAAGDLLLTPGQRSTALYVLVAGRMQVVASQGGEREFVMSTLWPGDYVGEASLIDGEPQPATVRAQIGSRVLVLGQRVFARCLGENPALAYAVLLGLTQRLRAAYRTIHSLALVDVYGRVAQVLIEMPGGRSASLINRGRVSPGEIARLVGASREAVSRVLSSMKASQLIRMEDDGSIAVTEALTESVLADRQAVLADDTAAGAEY